MLPLIIAELGTSHNGSRSKAKELVAAAREAGASCVKVQIVYADEILHANTGTVPLPGGNVRLYDVFKKLEVGIDFYAEIKEYAENLGISFLATPFGLRSAAELKTLKTKAVKVASPELNYVQLLKELSDWNIDVFLSCGVSKLSDIETALSFFDTQRKAQVTLLHCVTDYPAPVDQYNLKLLASMRFIFGVQTGVSDHSLDPIIVPVLSLACGGAAIEKHFCLSRKDEGLDDKIALDPKDFSKMCSALKTVQNKTGSEIIDDMRCEYGGDFVNAVLGDGVKRLAPCEEQNYTRTNRSIHALHEIKKGEVFTTENLSILRSEKVLRPGMAPIFYENILGCTASKDIPCAQGVRLEDVFHTAPVSSMPS
ncbi:MAG: N-acetylneuraminate synthase family protein [Termitinemataceae bacterium]|nr:MAG: N-acetylneuraminate synthase family protein [Termitinemataceae bacterium]